jgi:Ca2+-binding RTX toxin-like protein
MGRATQPRDHRVIPCRASVIENNRAVIRPDTELLESETVMRHKSDKPSQLELLELRQVLSVAVSAGVLSLVGSATNDRYLVAQSGTNLTVQENGGAVRTFPLSSITRINARLDAGMVKLSLPATVRIPVSVIGGLGNDSITTGAGNDSVFGQAGVDSILGNDGNDDLNAGYAGTDPAIATTGADLIDGGAGNDRLSAADASGMQAFGRAGRDTIAGAGGHDTLYGGGDNDLIMGAGGDDRILPGLGADTLFAGAGRDTLDFSDLREGIIASVESLPGTPAHWMGAWKMASGHSGAFGSTPVLGASPGMSSSVSC